MPKAKTDRQTDKPFVSTARSTWWGPCTSYDTTQWDTLSKGPFPQFVKAVYGGIEKCPTTGKDHYQFAIHTAQVRGSQILDWLPGIHLEVANSKEAVKKYCMKAETAVGDKKEVENTRKYMEMHDSLIRIAQSIDGYEINRESKCWEADEYWYGVRKIIAEEPFRIAQFSVPVMEKAWVRTREVWKNLARASVLQPAPPAHQVPSRTCPVCNERMSRCGCSEEEDLPDSESEIFLAEP